MTKRWWILQIAGLFITLAMYRQGWLGFVLSHDVTIISYTILTVFWYGIITSAFNLWKQTDFSKEVVVTLGFLGTVIGLLLALTSINPSDLNDFNNISNIFTGFARGLGVAFSTTIVGGLCGLWLAITQHFCQIDDK